MPTRFFSSPASAFLYRPVLSRWISVSIGHSTNTSANRPIWRRASSRVSLYGLSMAACSTIPPPRVTRRQTQASLRASRLRASSFWPCATFKNCSASPPSSTSTVFPSRRKRLARPAARVDFPAPLIPVNHTVNPADVVPFMSCDLRGGTLSWKRTLPVALPPCKQMPARSSMQLSRFWKLCDHRHLFFSKIDTRGVPGIEPRGVDPGLLARDDQILDARPQRLGPAAQGHLAVLAGEISADVGVGVDDGGEPAAALLRLAQRGEKRFRIHHVAVAAAPPAGHRRRLRASDVRDGHEPERSVAGCDHQPATFRRIRASRVRGDLRHQRLEVQTGQIASGGGR